MVSKLSFNKIIILATLLGTNGFSIYPGCVEVQNSMTASEAHHHKLPLTKVPAILPVTAFAPLVQMSTQ